MNIILTLPRPINWLVQLHHTHARKLSMVANVVGKRDEGKGNKICGRGGACLAWACETLSLLVGGAVLFSIF